MTPEGSPFTRSVTYSPDNKPEIDPCRPFCLCLDNPNDVALDTVSQYTILPVEGIITIRPGGPAVAVDKRTPRGADAAGSLHGSGNARVKISAGDGDEAEIE